MRRATQRDDGKVEVLTLLLNASDTPIDFALPAPSATREVLIDSAQPDREPFAIEDDYGVQPHSAVLICWVGEEVAA